MEHNITGIWTGSMVGTTTASVSADMFQENDKIAGTVRANEPVFGLILYRFKGRVVKGTKFTLDMIPDKDKTDTVRLGTIKKGDMVIEVEIPPIEYGKIYVEGNVVDEDHIEGYWESTNGHAGVVKLERQL